jgi:predicted dinucleotide-binding enzyme
MRIGVIGSGRIGGTVARLLAGAGHEVLISYSRDPASLAARAAEIGHGARAGTPAEAAAFGEVVVLSVRWRLVDEVLAEVGGLEGRIVVDTNNQFGASGLETLPDGLTAAQLDQRRMPRARLVKTFNTVTAGFLADSAGRTGPDRVVMFMCGDDAEAKAVVAGLVEDAGFTPVDMGALADAAPMEPPRRTGAVYGEEYHEAEARAFVAGLRR